jgi:DNA-binding SARP family transcriptional activator/tetratricopeptide (TPR) repeat protein
MLAMRAGRLVTLGELVEGLWGERSPASAEGSVYTYVSGLRSVLEPGRSAHGGRSVLERARAGYVLSLDAADVDALVVERLRGHAREQRGSGDISAALSALDKALGLWQGEVLAGLPGPFAESERVRLTELRWGLLEDRAELALALRRHAEVAAELIGLVREQPLRERLVGLAMTALYRSGRQADALAMFGRARTVLAEELGVDPGPALGRLYEQILRSAPDLQAVPVQSAGSGSADTITAEAASLPAQLPHDVAGFAGRNAELAWLRGLVSARTTDAGGADDVGSGGREGMLVISAIDGIGGVGKTALAVRFAHQVASSFPGGQLYVDLRGFDPAAPPLEEAAALRHLLRGLGADPRQLPDEVDELAAEYRSRLAGRAVLVLLDNAVNSAQVARLLPGGGRCLTIVTSRNRLSGLVARHGARRLTLDTLSASEARQLLGELVGPQQAGADPDGLAELVGLCAGLPLALRIVAERLLTDRGRSPTEFAAELRSERDRLDMLTVDDDPAAAVRAVLSWSYEALKPEPARLFRLLALHPGPEVPVDAAAALTGQPRAEVRTALATLTNNHLLEEPTPRRYRQHDLLRLYASELTRAVDSDPARAAALQRVLDFYLHTIHRATQRVDPGNLRFELDPPIPGSQPLDFADADTAFGWMAQERVNLPLAVRAADAAGLHPTTWRLAASLAQFTKLHATEQDWLDITSRGVAAAEACGDRDGQARLLRRRAWALAETGDGAAAIAEMERARPLYEQIGDVAGAGDLEMGMAFVESNVFGRHHAAVARELRAKELFESLHDERRIAQLNNNIGYSYIQIGNYEQSIYHLRLALAGATRLGNSVLRVYALDNLGVAELKAGHPEQALTILTDLFDHHGNDLEGSTRVEALTARARCHRLLGDPARALDDATEAVAASATTHTQTVLRAEALYELGQIHIALGHPETAIEPWQQSLTILETINHTSAPQHRAELRALTSTAGLSR